MNAYEKAVELGLSGTDAEIVTILKSTGLTARPILLDELMDVLNIPLKMLRQLPRTDSDGSKWSGTLFNMLLWVEANGTPEQIDGLGSFFSHITNDRNLTFDTTNLSYGSQFWAVAQAFGGTAPGFPSVADFAAIADLGGGWLFADLTVEQFAAQRTTATEAADKADYLATQLATLQAVIDPVQTKLNAIATWGQTADVLALSVAEYEAYIDGLMATADGNPV